MALFFANQANAALIDQNYEAWRQDPSSVDPTWAAFFEGFELGNTAAPGGNGAVPEKAAPVGEVPLQTRVDALVYAYRTLGHTIAHTDPLAKHRPQNPLLSLSEFGFSEKDLDLSVSSKFIFGGKAMRLREMVAKLESIYSSNIGFEFMHSQNPRVRNWLRERIETRGDWSVDAKTKTRMLRHLMKVEMFENFLHTRFQGVKRFSVEGGEALISALDGVLENCPKFKVEEICMGMAHRGRLAVIVEFLKKPYSLFLKEFNPNYIPESVFGDGDVKYHLGYVNTREIKPSGAKVDVRLSANPSHLEIVNPVVMGMARARQRVRKDTDERSRVVPILIHGDAAFAGQGVVTEVLNMSQLPGYRVGGTVHLVINNQIGFTTSPADARSTQYCTDVAKMIEAPIFHVNGDDPIAVRYCAELAFEFRQQFKGDVVIDMVCYRRHGHNEVDEPAYTQPLMYDMIGDHQTVTKLFRQRLVDDGTITAEGVQAMEKELLVRLEQSLEEAKTLKGDKYTGSTSAGPQPEYTHKLVETAVPKEKIAHIVKALTTPPEGFHVNSKLQRFFLDKRSQVFAKGEGFDWSYGEALAFGSLLSEGVPVRLSGQDCRRGTFTQRHAYLYDDKNRDRWCALDTMAKEGNTRICIYNSLLSEAGVLGFDYGYSLNYPEMLCLWEAQFGDFANGAQVVIDQFIASAESKWQRTSGIVLLLPHGYEGQGPEHSSARLERFLQLCAEKNIEVANLTTPAQYFHILRRHMKRAFKKPLVLMTPKSMLRLEAAASKLEDFTNGRFQEIIGDASANPKSVKRVIVSTGKVFYDLEKFRTEQKIGDTALVRVEQIYPLHEDALKAELTKYPNATKFVWAQEEPQNMGAWNFIMPRLRDLLDVAGFADKKLRYAGRKPSASPAVGSKGISDLEQKKLIEDAFTL
jgi:2-oxoglutarate dehydrogenase E1 component